MDDSNPLIRALALRTMSYIHVREFVEAAVPPVKILLKDQDPYVRKTAAFTVAKLYDHDRQLVEASDLIDRLNGMLRDDNPTVVASALAALMDIWERSETIKLTIDYASASKIVQILPDCSEYVSPIICNHWLRSIQVVSDLHTGSFNVIRTPRNGRGTAPGRTDCTSLVPFKFSRGPYVHPGYIILNELHRRRKANLFSLSQTFATTCNITSQGPGGPIPCTSERSPNPSKTTRSATE